MGIATEMKKLTHDIASSHADRVKQLAEIKGETKQVMAEAEALLKSFQTSRKQTGRQLRKDLARATVRRESEVSRMLGEAQKLLAGFHTSHREEGARMRRKLAKATAELHADVNGILKDAQQVIGSFQTRRKEMGEELHRELAQGQAEREAEVNKMRSSIRQGQAAVRADLNEAAAAWQGLAHTTPAKRVKVKVPPAAEKTPDLEAKLLAAINEHPNGITLTEVANRLGVAPIVFGRASKTLLEKGEIRKKDKLYFPVTG